MIRILLLTLLLVSRLTLGDSEARPHPEVKVATFANYAPFCFYAADADQSQYQEVIEPGQRSRLFRGLAWEVVLNSFQRSGYRVHLYIVPWTRAMKMLDQGLVDAVFPAIKNPSRLAKYQFSAQRVYPKNDLLLYTRANDQQLITGLDNLAGKRVATIRGFSYGSTWDQFTSSNDLNNINVNDAKQGFNLLEKGRIDALVGYQLSHDYHLKNWNKTALFSKTAAFDQAHSFLMGRSDNAPLMNDYDQGRAALDQQGDYQQLLQKWGMDGLD